MADQPEVLKPDLCVIGAGSGGLSVAAIGAALGASVVLIERGEMGGECLNAGCVPSKALIAAASKAQALRDAPQFGVFPTDHSVKFNAVMAHVRSVIAAIAPNDSAARFTAMGVTVIRAEASFRDKRTVVAGGREIRARRFVIATGSSPALPPIDGLADVPFLTNETVFQLDELPPHLAIIGAGPIGMELGQAFQRLGSRVRLLEAASALPREDPELARFARDALIADGVDLIENAKIEKISNSGKGIRLALGGADPRIIEVSHVLVAAGRRPNAAGLALENAGIQHDRRGIAVDARLRTSNKRVYAVGDAATGPQFTHAANYQAGLVVRHALFRLPVRADYGAIPRVTYTRPEIASVGLTEAEARARHGKVEILRWPYSENDRAQAERQITGEIKVIMDRKGRVLGCGIAGAQAGELIALWTLAVSHGLKAKDIAALVFAYPTLSEISKRAAVAFFAPKLQSRWLKLALKLGRIFG